MSDNEIRNGTERWIIESLLDHNRKADRRGAPVSEHLIGITYVVTPVRATCPSAGSHRPRRCHR
jgi:hypothetical protein